jgi:hypothetical protein
VLQPPKRGQPPIIACAWHEGQHMTTQPLQRTSVAGCNEPEGMLFLLECLHMLEMTNAVQ